MMLALYYGIFFLPVYPCFALCAVVPPCIVPWPYPNPTLFGSVPMFPLLCVGQSNPHIFIFLTIQVFGLVSLFYKNEILYLSFVSSCVVFFPVPAQYFLIYSTVSLFTAFLQLYVIISLLAISILLSPWVIPSLSH